uniref:ARAD1B13794p n=1 Tax=Blastobotrys adeninivorans TaxID=409370 RepID=A0A060T6Q0_BLAAD
MGKFDNTEEYERRARERSQAEYEARQKRGRERTPERETGARSKRVDIYEGLNQVTLVPAGAATGRRGKGVGFYCEVCDITLKDSLDFADHLNSKKHLYAAGVKEKTTRATLEDVKKRLDYLRKKVREQQADQIYDIQKRIAERKRIEEEERAARRARKARKLQRQSAAAHNDDNGNDEVAAAMGFSGFGGSKK